MTTATLDQATSSEVVLLLKAWAAWQRRGQGTVRPRGFPNQSVEGSRHNFAVVGGAGQKTPTALGVETHSLSADSDARGWSAEVEQVEQALVKLRARRLDLFLVVIAHYMDWVPNGRGGWRRVEFNAVRGLDEHRRKLAALMGSTRLPDGSLKPVGPRAFANRLHDAHVFLEALLTMGANRERSQEFV